MVQTGTLPLGKRGRPGCGWCIQGIELTGLCGIFHLFSAVFPVPGNVSLWAYLAISLAHPVRFLNMRWARFSSRCLGIFLEPGGLPLFSGAGCVWEVWGVQCARSRRSTEVPAVPSGFPGQPGLFPLLASPETFSHPHSSFMLIYFSLQMIH